MRICRKVFSVSSGGDWTTSAAGSQWALNGSVNWGCTNAGGCGFIAPSTPGTATVTLRIRGVVGKLNIEVIDPNGCLPAPTYAIRNTVTYTGPGTDVPGQPILGTVAQCQTVCNSTPGCVGFSRAKNQATTAVAQCWLKANISRSISNDSTWQTYVKQ